MQRGRRGRGVQIVVPGSWIPAARGGVGTTCKVGVDNAAGVKRFIFLLRLHLKYRVLGITFNAAITFGIFAHLLVQSPFSVQRPLLPAALTPPHRLYKYI